MPRRWPDAPADSNARHRRPRFSSFHTIRVFDFGITNEGTFYYDGAAGDDLESLVKEFGPRPPAAARQGHLPADATSGRS
jgi:hypothetical protein